MDLFWKTLGAAFISTILVLVLERQSRDFSLLVTLAAAMMITIAGVRLLEPVVDFLGELEALGDLSGDMLLSLMKVFGIGMTGELAASVCSDAGNSSLGKGIRFLTNSAILYLSIPVFTSLTDLFLQLLGDV